MIRPTLEYCAGVWWCCGEVNSGTLEILQKRVGRIAIKTSSSDTALKALKWPSLRSRRDEHILKLVRKCLHGRYPQYFKNYFVFNNDICVRSTRQSNLLHLPAMRTEVAKRSFYYHGSMVFNSYSKCLYFLMILYLSIYLYIYISVWICKNVATETSLMIPSD